MQPPIIKIYSADIICISETYFNQDKVFNDDNEKQIEEQTKDHLSNHMFIPKKLLSIKNKWHNLVKGIFKY